MRYDAAIVPQQMNRELTPELEREVKFFLKWGYLIVENAIKGARHRRAEVAVGWRTTMVI